MNDILSLHYIAASFIYAMLGIAVFWGSFILIDKLTPYALWKSIVEDRNQALATVVAAMCLGIAIIVAAAING